MLIREAPVLRSVFMALVVAIAALAPAADAQTPTGQLKLIRLYRVGSAPPSAYLDPQIFRRSQWIGSPVMGIPSRTSAPGHFWFRYSHCPVTARGAFRLTVYESVDEGPSPSSRRPVRTLKQFSMTLVDWRLSDNADYMFWARGQRYYYYHVEIPAAKGCVWREGQYLG